MLRGGGVSTLSLAMRICPKCSTENPDYIVRCRNCGKKLGDLAEVSESTVEAASRDTRFAFVAGLVASAILVAVSVLATAGFSLGAFGTASLVDAGLIAGLSYGVLKKNRTCAVLLLLFYLAGAGLIAAETKVYYPLLVRAVFVYFFARGAYGAFVWHRELRKRVATATGTSVPSDTVICRACSKQYPSYMVRCPDCGEKHNLGVATPATATSFFHFAGNYAVFAVLASLVWHELLPDALRVLFHVVPAVGAAANGIQLALIISAIPAGILALCGIPKYGRAQLLWQGVLGVIGPAVLFFLLMPAMEKVRANRQNPPASVEKH